jgi:hypothetical protein
MQLQHPARRAEYDYCLLEHEADRYQHSSGNFSTYLQNTLKKEAAGSSQTTWNNIPEAFQNVRPQQGVGVTQSV